MGHTKSPFDGFETYNQLLNEDGLTDTGTTEETNLTTTGVGGKQIDDLDTSDENLGLSGLLNELGSLSVNGTELVGLDGTTLVNGVTSDVDDTAESTRADGDGDGSTGVTGGSTTGQTLSTCGTLMLATARRVHVEGPG